MGAEIIIYNNLYFQSIHTYTIVPFYCINIFLRPSTIYFLCDVILLRFSTYETRRLNYRRLCTTTDVLCENNSTRVFSTTLMCSRFNSSIGIQLPLDQPMNVHTLLNIDCTALLCQYFGRKVDKLSNAYKA